MHQDDEMDADKTHESQVPIQVTLTTNKRHEMSNGEGLSLDSVGESGGSRKYARVDGRQSTSPPPTPHAHTHAHAHTQAHTHTHTHGPIQPETHMATHANYEAHMHPHPHPPSLEQDTYAPELGQTTDQHTTSAGPNEPENGQEGTHASNSGADQGAQIHTDKATSMLLAKPGEDVYKHIHTHDISSLSNDAHRNTQSRVNDSPHYNEDTHPTTSTLMSTHTHDGTLMGTHTDDDTNAQTDLQPHAHAHTHPHPHIHADSQVHTHTAVQPQAHSDTHTLPQTDIDINTQPDEPERHTNTSNVPMEYTTHTHGQQHNATPPQNNPHHTAMATSQANAQYAAMATAPLADAGDSAGGDGVSRRAENGQYAEAMTAPASSTAYQNFVGKGTAPDPSAASSDAQSAIPMAAGEATNGLEPTLTLVTVTDDGRHLTVNTHNNSPTDMHTNTHNTSPTDMHTNSHNTSPTNMHTNTHDMANADTQQHMSQPNTHTHTHAHTHAHTHVQAQAQAHTQAQAQEQADNNAPPPHSSQPATHTPNAPTNMHMNTHANTHTNGHTTPSTITSTRPQEALTIANGIVGGTGNHTAVQPATQQYPEVQDGSEGLSLPNINVERLRKVVFYNVEETELSVDNTPNINEIWLWVQHWFSVTGSRRVWKHTTDYGKTFYCKLGPKKKGKQYQSAVPVERQRVAIPLSGVDYDCPARISVRFFADHRVKTISAPVHQGKHNHTMGKIDCIRLPQPIKDFIVQQKRLGLDTLSILKLTRAQYPYVKIKSQDIRNAPIKTSDAEEESRLLDYATSQLTAGSQLALTSASVGSIGLNESAAANLSDALQQLPPQTGNALPFRDTTATHRDTNKHNGTVTVTVAMDKANRDALITQLQTDIRQSQQEARQQQLVIDRLTTDNNRVQQRMLSLETQMLTDRLRMEERVKYLETKLLHK